MPKLSAKGAITLADIPERQTLRRLQRAIERLRDMIAELDLEIEILREQLGTFEAQYAGRMRPQHSALKRVQAVVQHMERWIELMERAVPEQVTPQHIAAQAVPLNARRARELHRQTQLSAQAKAAEPAAEAPWHDSEARAPELRERLKSAYRELARRYHPDLARTEEERLRHSEMMARINALYRAGDVDRLLAMREQARGAELDSDLSVEQEIVLLTERHRWFEAVLKNLQEERAALEQSATCELWRNVQQASQARRDLLQELQAGLQQRVVRAFHNVPRAAHALEVAVSRYNRELTSPADSALEAQFDPYTDKSLVRLALESLGASNASPAAQKRATWLEELALNEPSVLRLILFTYITELSPMPLLGLESYDDLQLRFNTLVDIYESQAPVHLQEALVDADAQVEWGVRRATEKIVHVGLRFVDVTLREAVPLALQTLDVRRHFKRVLGVLGEHTTCDGCHAAIFAVPLYRTRGLDDLRASVCPQCGHTLRSYWMPRGKDVQAVLGPVFIDYEIVYEFSFSLGRAAIAMQLVPFQLETMTVADLRERFIVNVLARHDIAIDAVDVLLYQKDAAADPTALLASLQTPLFEVRFAASAKLSENDALEMIRHRIRTRFT